MRYLSNTLLAGEKIVFNTRPHWVVYGPCFLAVFITLLFWDQSAKLASLNFIIAGKPLFEWAYMGLILAAIYLALQGWVRYISSEYGVTNKRVIMKTGLVQRNAFDTFLVRIEGIKVDQSILGRILNYGTILVVGTGGTQDAFYAVPNPLHFRRIVQEQMDREMTESQQGTDGN